MQNTSNEDFGALLPSKKRGGWRRVSAASWDNMGRSRQKTLAMSNVRSLTASKHTHQKTMLETVTARKY
jgi:hypothetical protein